MRAREAAEARRRTLRSIFIFIIIITLPFYCLGFLLWGTTPRPVAATPAPSATPGILPTADTATNTPSGPASITPFTFAPGTSAPFPTSVPFTSIPVTRFLSPTPTFNVLPTATPLPTNPPAPTNPPPPPSVFTEPPLLPASDTPGP